MRNRIATLTLSGVLSLLLTGCAELSWQSPFDVGNTVTNKSRTQRFTDPDDIEIISNPDPQRLTLLSVITGDSCQTRWDQPAASRQQALSFLREDAARFGADAIIQLQCYQLPQTADSRCYTQVSCFAKAAAFTD